MASLDSQGFLTAEEACRLLGVKPATLYAYIGRDVLSSYRQGIRRRRLYLRQEVEQLLALRPSGAPGPTRTTLPRAEDWIPFVS